METTMSDGIKHIVILGDWFIDENWLMRKHYSASSSFGGKSHYLIENNDVSKTIISLCGASIYMAILRPFLEKKEEDYFLTGFGLWNPDDDEVLKCVLCEKENTNLNHFKLIGPKIPTVGKDKCFYKTGDTCSFESKAKLSNLTKNDQIPTNRIIRTYQLSGKKNPLLMQRFDWEIPEIVRSTISDSTTFNHNIPSEGVIHGVIVIDHGRGVVSENLIKKFIKEMGPRIKNARWYVRSTEHGAKWINTLNKIQFRLISESEIIRSEGPKKWHMGAELGRDFIDYIDPYRNNADRDCQYKKIAILCKDKYALAIDNSIQKANKKNTYYVRKKDVRKKDNAPEKQSPIENGYEAIFFSSLIAQDLEDENVSLGKQVMKAMNYAYEWKEKADKHFEDYVKQSNNKKRNVNLLSRHHFFGPYSEAFANKKMAKNYELKKFKFAVTKEEWKKTTRGNGVLSVNDKKILNLWRAETFFKGYYCITKDKREEINQLYSRVQQYCDNKGDHQHPLNIMLIASPGWGKSSLVEGIATKCDMRFMEFSLSRMASTDDLINCFDIIHSQQHGSHPKDLMIFMDEIDCNIDGHTAMGLLLSPIWDGTFVKHKKLSKLKPAVWVFATTVPLAKTYKLNKGKDFLSRLNGPVIKLDDLLTNIGENLSSVVKPIRKDLIINGKLTSFSNNAYNKFTLMRSCFKTEQVYIGASFLKTNWPNIQYTQLCVIDLLHGSLLINGIRSLQFFISHFNDIKGNTVTHENVPSLVKFPELNRHIVLPEIWRERKDPDTFINALKDQYKNKEKISYDDEVEIFQEPDHHFKQ